MDMINNLPKEELFAPGHRACAGCGASLAARIMLKATGKDVIVVNATGCLEVVSTPYPETAWRVPWIHAAFENNSAVASGIKEALKMLKKKTNVLCVGGDGATFDIGFQALSGALERGHDFCYCLYDNEAYMNTGIQRSSSTPMYASTSTSPAGEKIPGKLQPKKPLPFIIASHGIKYVATCSISNPQDMYKKIKKGIETEGPAFIHIFAPCPTGWRFPVDKTIEIAKLAIKCGVFPMYEIENGVLKFTEKVEKREPVETYLKMQGRFRHLNENQMKEVQKFVDDRYNFLLELEKREKAFDVLY